jgi:hypothetical protein
MFLSSSIVWLLFGNGSIAPAPLIVRSTNPNTSSVQAPQDPVLTTLAGLDQSLALSSAQKDKADPIISVHEQQITSILGRADLYETERKSQIRQSIVDLRAELQPILIPEQLATYDNLFKIQAPFQEVKRGSLKDLLPDIGVKGEVFLPSGSEARKLFGDSIFSIGLGLGKSEAIGNHIRLGFSLDSLSIDRNSNKLFIAAPELALEYREPLSKDIYGFARLLVGPAYMDYSYNDPSGNHYAAKRLGLDSGLELGVRYGQLRLGVEYKIFTQPANVNFDGFSASLTWTPIRI